MKWISLILGVLMFGNTFSQSKVIDRGILTPGDTYFHGTDHLPQNIQLNHRGSGKYHSWDFSSLMSAFIRQRVVEPVVPELLPGSLRKASVKLAGFDGLDRFYRFTESGIELLGMEIELAENVKLPAWFDDPIRQEGRISSPFTEEIETTLWSEPMPFAFFKDLGLAKRSGTDSLRLHFAFRITSDADANGTLSLPVGIFDVIRQKVEIRMQPVLMYKEKGKWNTFSGISGNLPWMAQKERHFYCFWADNSAEPIVVAETNQSGQAEKVYYQTPKWSGKLLEKLPEQQDVFAYPNPSFGPIRFDFFNLPPGQYTLEIFNILGVKLMSETFILESQRTFPMDLSNLKKGTYIYRLLNSDRNTIRSKRIVIISP